MLIRRHTKILIEELSQILQSGPSDTTAFLSAKTSARAVIETLAALANASGGVLVVGVNKRGKPQENVDVVTVHALVAESALQTEPPLILPSPQVLTRVDLVAAGLVAPITPESSPASSTETSAEAHSSNALALKDPIDGDTQLAEPKNVIDDGIVLIQIPAGLPHIYSAQGRYLTRTDSQNRPLSTSELRSLMLERGDTGYEGMPAPGVTLADLEEQKIERYLELISAPPDADPLQILLSRGCVVYDYSAAGEADADKSKANEQIVPTTAGVLLFGRTPQQFVRSAEIICVRYAGPTMTDEFVRQDIIGTLPEQIRQAEAFVSSNMRRGMRIAGMERAETMEYPMAVVREAIVNAIAHRDYSIRGEGIRLLMFSDRLEVYSPGRLPGHVTLDNLVDERYSRNEAIVAVLTDMGYIERLGYGIDRMISSMQEASLPAPRFTEMAAGFHVTLESAGEDLVSPTPVQQQWQHDFLNNRQEQALARVRESGRITNSDYQTMCPDVSPETLRRDLSDLVDKNYLIRIGNKKATYYILK